MIDIGIGELAWWQALLAVIIGIIGAARLTRVLVYDDFPPAIWVRVQWDRITRDGAWAKLVHCSWCFGYWAFVLALGSFVLSFLHPALGWAWWLLWGSLTGGYLVSQYVHFDEGNGGE